MPRIRDARPASPIPPPAAATAFERVVSVTGSVQVGVVQARKLRTVALDQRVVTVDDADTPITGGPAAAPPT